MFPSLPRPIPLLSLDETPLSSCWRASVAPRGARPLRQRRRGCGFRAPGPRDRAGRGPGETPCPAGHRAHWGRHPGAAPSGSAPRLRHGRGGAAPVLTASASWAGADAANDCRTMVYGTAFVCTGWRNPLGRRACDPSGDAACDPASLGVRPRRGAVCDRPRRRRRPGASAGARPPAPGRLTSGGLGRNPRAGEPRHVARGAPLRAAGGALGATRRLPGRRGRGCDQPRDPMPRLRGAGDGRLPCPAVRVADGGESAAAGDGCRAGNKARRPRGGRRTAVRPCVGIAAAGPPRCGPPAPHGASGGVGAGIVRGGVA